MDRKKCNRIRQLLLMLVFVVIGFLFGVLIMSLSSRRWRLKLELMDISSRIQQEIKADNIRNNLRYVKHRTYFLPVGFYYLPGPS